MARHRRCEVLHTPGHAPGAVCFYAPDLGVVFTGDTLFNGGPGATGRSFSDQRPASSTRIRDRLFALPRRDGGQDRARRRHHHRRRARGARDGAEGRRQQRRDRVVPVPDFIVALRRHIGHAELWMPGVTAVIRREAADGGLELLLVRRSDTGEWAPVTGILDPGEEPAVGARREAAEETGVAIRVDRLASVGASPPMTHVNGDRAVYLDHTFACTWVSGEAVVGDDESVEVRWFAVDALPPISPRLRERVDAALADEVATRFRA